MKRVVANAFFRGYRSTTKVGEGGRRFDTRLLRCISSTSIRSNRLIFIEPSGEEIEVTFEENDTILDVALDNDIDIEGACGGECACSTCHIILDRDDFDKFPEPDEEEEDMLDLALGLTDTSRLGCQIALTVAHDGMRVTLPEETESMMS